MSDVPTESNEGDDLNELLARKVRSKRARSTSILMVVLFILIGVLLGVPLGRATAPGGPVDRTGVGPEQGPPRGGPFGEGRGRGP